MLFSVTCMSVHHSAAASAQLLELHVGKERASYTLTAVVDAPGAMGPIVTPLIAPEQFLRGSTDYGTVDERDGKVVLVYAGEPREITVTLFLGARLVSCTSGAPSIVRVPVMRAPRSELTCRFYDIELHTLNIATEPPLVRTESVFDLRGTFRATNSLVLEWAPQAASRVLKGGHADSHCVATFTHASPTCDFFWDVDLHDISREAVADEYSLSTELDVRGTWESLEVIGSPQVHPVGDARRGISLHVGASASGALLKHAPLSFSIIGCLRFDPRQPALPRLVIPGLRTHDATITVRTRGALCAQMHTEPAGVPELVCGASRVAVHGTPDVRCGIRLSEDKTGPSAALKVLAVDHTVWPRTQELRHRVLVHAHAADAGEYVLGRVLGAIAPTARVDGADADVYLTRGEQSLLCVNLPATLAPTTLIDVAFTTAWDGASQFRVNRVGMSAPTYALDVRGMDGRTPRISGVSGAVELGERARVTEFDTHGCPSGLDVRLEAPVSISRMLAPVYIAAAVMAVVIARLCIGYTKVAARTAALAMALDIDFTDGQWAAMHI